MKPIGVALRRLLFLARGKGSSAYVLALDRMTGYCYLLSMGTIIIHPRSRIANMAVKEIIVRLKTLADTKCGYAFRSHPLIRLLSYVGWKPIIHSDWMLTAVLTLTSRVLIASKVLWEWFGWVNIQDYSSCEDWQMCGRQVLLWKAQRERWATYDSDSAG